MNSCLYRCTVMHHRSKPKKHGFNYRCFAFCIDLDELSALERAMPLFGHNRRSLYELRDQDHFQQGRATLKENVAAYLADTGVSNVIGQVLLVTNLRTWGYVFNPVSFYFVHDRNGDPLCAIAEVANTFDEQKLYSVAQTSAHSERFEQSHPKRFYVSPYSKLDTTLHFDLQSPGDRLSVKVNESDGDGMFFHSSLIGERVELSNRSLARVTLRFPFMTLSVIAGIHWQALKMHLKKIPFYRKSERPDQQTEVRPYLNKKRQKAHSIL